MNQSLSNGTNVIRFGNIFVRVCMILSIVLSNMMIDVSSVQANTTNGSYGEDIAIPEISDKVVEAPEAADGDVGFTMVMYPNMEFLAPAYAILEGEEINYDWGESGPDGLGNDNFSIRWYGRLVNNEITVAEEFTFTSTSDDGAALWINNDAVIPDSGGNVRSGTYTIEPGVAYDFVYQFCENGGLAYVQLEMESASVARRYLNEADFLEVDLTGIHTEFADSKTGALADGIDYVTESITLLDGNDDPISANVYVSVVGRRVSVNGAEVSEGDWVQAAESSTTGVYEFNLSSMEPGEKEIFVRYEGFPLEETHTYDFLLADENSGLRGEYYPNMTLTEPSFGIIENEILDINWENDAPMVGMSSDGYSVRWTGYLTPEYSEMYTFYTYSDDGIRVWIDGTLMVDSWVTQSPTYHTGYYEMTAGQEYGIVAEYFENSGGALVGLEWKSDSLEREVVTRENLSMPADNDYTVSIGFSSTEIVGNGVDASMVTVSLTDEEGNPVYDENVYIRVSGTGNTFNGVDITESEWTALLPVGEKGQYIGDLKSMTSEDKIIRFMVGVDVDSNEYEVTVTEPGSGCVETTQTNDEGEEETYLTVPSGLVCELEVNSISYNNIIVVGDLILSPAVLGQSIDVYADVIDVTSTGEIRGTDVSSEMIYHAQSINVDGLVTANGGEGEKGGILHIIADQLSGSGSIQANGGTGDKVGSGGDVIIEISDNQFAGNIEAYGGEKSGARGNPGLIQFIQQGRLIIDNNGLDGEYTFTEGEYSFTRIELGANISLYFTGEESIINISDGIYTYYDVPSNKMSVVYVEGTIPNYEEIFIDEHIWINYDNGNIGEECVIEYDDEYDEYNLQVNPGEYCWLSADTYDIDNIVVLGMLYLVTDEEAEIFDISLASLYLGDSGKIRVTENSGIIRINSDGVNIYGILDSGSRVGGDGGEIDIDATYYFGGSGKIKANGDDGETPGNGGKVNIYVEHTNMFTGEIQAFSGINGTEVAKPGTIEHNGKLIIDNNGLGGSISFPEGEYTYDRIELGNGIELTFEGMGTILTVNDGFYGEGDVTPIVNLDGNLITTDDFIIDDVILNWDGYIDFDYSVDISASEVQRNGYSESIIEFTLADTDDNPISSNDVYIRVSGEGNKLDGILMTADEWINLEESSTQGKYIVGLSSTVTGTKMIEFKVGDIIIPDDYSVEFIELNFGHGFIGEYFENDTFEGEPCSVVYGETIDFEIGNEWPNSTASGCVNVGSIRWKGIFLPGSTKTYQFFVSNENINLWVDEIELVGDSLSIDCTSGIYYPMLVEMSGLSEIESEQVNIQWSWDGQEPVVIPSNSLGFANIGQSTMTTSVNTIKADGVDTSEITIQARRDDGRVFPNYRTYIKVEGTENYLNGILLPDNQWAVFGNLDANGNVSGNISTKSSGIKEIKTTIIGMMVPDTATLEAKVPDVSGLQILLDGETVDTQAEGGKTGDVVPLYRNDPVHVELRTVDGSYGLLEAVNGTAILNVANENANYDATINIVDGIGDTYIIWPDTGEQTFSITGEGVLGALTVSETVSIADTLIVADGETVYADAVRTYLTTDVTTGDSSLTVADTTGFYPGHQILLLKMTGDDAGEHEILNISSTTGNQLILETSPSLSYSLASETTQVILIPRIEQITIESGGKLTINSWNGTTGGVLYLDVNELVVESGAVVHANYMGYGGGTGPGAGVTANTAGGYGGEGGSDTYPATDGKAYGSPTEPFMLGSGGGSPCYLETYTCTISGGPGGGIIKINANHLTNNGTISSNGRIGGSDNTAYIYGSGGSGGSIWIIANEITGSGKMQVNGGQGAWNWGGGFVGSSAGGGRIAINVIDNQYTGSVEAFTAYNTRRFGGAGTIYWTNEDRLVLDNYNYGTGIYKSGLASGNYNFTTVELKRRGALSIYGEDSSFNLSETNIIGDANAIIMSEGELVVNGDLLVSNYSLDVQGGLTGVTDLIVDENRTVDLYATTAIHSGVYYFDNVEVRANAKLVLHSIDDLDENYSNDVPFEIESNNFSIAKYGKVSLDGTGYRYTMIDGNGPGGGVGFTEAQTYGVGGAHGGLAGESPKGNTSAEIYGNLQNPVTMGSAGGTASAGGYASAGIGGNGGGALHLVVGNIIDIDGVITANGLATSCSGEFRSYVNCTYYDPTGGGGAGGSIWIEAGEVDGSGSLIANGGTSPDSSGGGGGRLAVLTDVLDLDIGLSVEGGQGNSAGEHGSIYLGAIDPGLSSVIADPTEVEVGGIAASDVLATLVVGNGHGAPYKSIDVTLIDGSTVFIDGSPLLLNQSISVSETDMNGELHFDVSATTPGSRELIVTVDGVELNDHVVLDFTVGDFEPAYSTIVVEPQNIPADGVSVATITATANDIEYLPIMDIEIGLSADGDAEVTQPTAPTNEYGQAVGYVSDATVENVTVTAEAWGIPFLNSTIVNFYGTDFVSTLDVPQRVVPAQDVQIGVNVRNLESYDVENVVVELTLPELLSYSSDTSGITPVISDQTYQWTIAELAAGEWIQFTVNASVSSSAMEGETIALNLSSSSAVSEIDPSNNVTQAEISVVQGYSYDSSITPNDALLYIGGEAVYSIQVKNTDILPDLYSISVAGLDAFNVELSDTELAVNSGGSKKATLRVGTDVCISDPLVNFSVLITSNESGIVQELAGTVTIDSAPKIILDAPANNATSGSQSVLFSWRTDPATTGTLTLYPTDDPDAVQTYTTESGTSHTVQVENLTRNTSYTWHVDAASDCGSNSSVDRVLNIGNGIVFANHNQSITINRDYDQRINVAVQNTDTIAHTLTSSVLNPYEDLIVNFVDSGSVDQTITLEPGETANLTLALHAQDAGLHNYTLTANLIADADSEPIVDNATLNVDVLFEGDYSIVEEVAAYDPVTLAHTYVITNHGQAITDLSLEAIDPNTGLPASVYLTPSIDHAKLETGESLRVVAYPIFDEQDVVNQSAFASSSHLAKENMDTLSDIPFTLNVKAGGIEKTISGIASCGDGRGIYTVIRNNCELKFTSGNWYCTNRPVVTTSFSIPAFLKREVISDLSVTMSFSPQSNAKDHNGTILFNGDEVANFEDLLPDGSYTFGMPVENWNEAIAGTVNQDVTVVSTHPNSGHYIVSNDYSLNIGVKNAKTFVCAATQEEAEQIADVMYPCGATVYFDPETDVYEKSIWALGEIKKLIKSVAAENDIDVSVSICTQGECGDPIDSRTGVFSFATPDISFPTSAGTLAFQRTYSTGAVEQYSSVGYGWIHNHAERLIFPDSTDGMDGYMIFRDHFGNQHLFKVEEDGTYTAGPGVLAELQQTTDGYTVTSPDGHVFTFNTLGMILSLMDAQGNAFTYTYDEEGVLQRVSADNGTRYLDFTYNEDFRITAVTDYTGRVVTFEYDEDANLIQSTDLLDQEWTYEYDANHRMTALNDPSGLETVSTEYDMLGRAFKQFDSEGNLLIKIVYHDDGSITVEDASGHSETHSYDSRGIMIDETDQVNRDTTTDYDANFRPTSITNEIGSELTMEWSEDGKQLLAEIDPAGNRTEYTYDENGNLTSTTDPSGNVKSYTYEGKLLTGSTDIEGKTTTYTYTDEGWLETQTDSYGRTTSYTYDEHGQRLTTTDWLGEVTTNVYDELGRQIESVDEQGRVNRNEYNNAGQLVRSIRNYAAGRPQNDQNLYNLTTTYTYDVYGNQKTVTDTLGNTTTYNYDSSGHLISTVDALGNESTNTYDGNGQLVKTSDALGRSTTYVYDAAGRRLSTINALGVSSGTTSFNLTNNSSTANDSEGNAATYYYNALNQVVRIVDPMNHETTTTYNANGNVETKTDELGRTTTYEYDALNRLVKTTDASGAVTQTVYNEDGYRSASIDALGHQTTYTYDEMGRVIATTDALGHTTSSDYDEEGKLVSSTDAMGRTTSYTYDEWGRKASMTDGAGRTTTYTYDVLDRVISTSGPTGTTSIVYDALGRVVSSTDARGHTTTTTYDDLGRVKTTTDDRGNTTTNYYDQVGNLLSSVDSQGTTSYEYDALNRQIAVTDPLGNRTRTVYDTLGNVSDTINARGVVTHYIYDSLQRNTAIIQNYKPGEEADADTNVRVDYTYNAVGNRIYVNDANGHVTEFQYDAANRVTRKIDPIGNTWDYVYDLAGNLTSRTDGNHVTTSFVYDDGGNLLTIDYPDGEADVSFTYNNAGQRVTMTDGIGTTTWNYDDLSRVESVNDAYGNEIVYSYDVYGNRTGLQYADGKQVAYDFDTNNRLIEVASWDSLETEYDYDALGQLTNILRPNGVESTYEYDALGRLTTLKHTSDSSDLANYTYTYDEVGNIIHAEENVMGGGSYGPTIQVTVVETTGEPLEGKTVYAYSGDAYSNYSKVTDEKGRISITLPEGTYRFRVDVDGTEFWSGETDHCEIGACGEVNMTIPEAVLVTVIDSNNNVLADQTVYAYEGEMYSSHSSKTDENGQVSLRLSEGAYRFKTIKGGTTFWSAALDEEQCVVPGCTVAEIMVTVPLVVTVQNDLGDPMANLNVYAYEGETYSNISGKTDEYGQVALSLPEGKYRFRADYNGTQFWSAAANLPSGEGTCTIPGCSEVAITVSLPVTVTVVDTAGNLISGVNVYAYDGSTYRSFSKKTDANGEAVFTLPGGEYRFRADYNATQFWSGTENTCEIPGCTTDAVTVTQPITVTVLDSNGAVQAGLNVYAYNGTTYAGYSKKTDANGVAVFTLPLNDYRFRADLNGTQFWSGADNTCSLPDCGTDQVSMTIPVQVLVQDGENPLASINVYAFNGTTYSGYSKTTGSDGVAIFTLPEGEYRFRADYAGEQIFSAADNHCTIPGCELVSIQLGTEVVPTETAAATDIPTFTPVFTNTLPSTPVQTTLPAAASTATPGNSATPAVVNSNTPVLNTNTPVPQNTNTPEPEQSNTPVPDYSATPTIQETGTVGMLSRAGHTFAKAYPAPLADDTGVSVTVMDSDGTPQSGLNVYAFDGSTFSGSHAVTNESGIASFTLAEGSYRFRADLNGTQFWSDTENHCSTPTCSEAGITVTKPLSITVVDSDGTVQSGLNVYAFNGTTYAGYSKVTNESGQAMFTLPEGDYRFRADLNGTQFWSSTENHCTLPGCESAAVTVTKPLTVTVRNSDGTAQSGLNVYAFNGTTYAGYSKVTNESGQAVFTLPEGDYRFRADLNGTQFWSDDENHPSGEGTCPVPGCESVDVSITVPLTVSVVDTDGTPQSGIAVYAFNGTTYQGYSKTTDEYGQAVFTLPEGDYRFRADVGGTQYWSSETNECTLPGCSTASVTTSKPVTVSVVDSYGTVQVGLNLYAFNGSTYAGYSKVSDEYGNAVFYLPSGDYRFRADLNGTQFWSAEENTCTLPGCENVIVTVTLPVTVTVVDTDGAPASGINVYAFDGTTYKNYSKVTDENGQAIFSLPVGDYRFRADLNGTQFWSADENTSPDGDTCTLPGCVTDSVTVTKPLTVTVAGEEGNPYADLNVYVFDGETYAGYSGKTDTSGHVTFTLPQGEYHFRADYDGVQFWSGNENTCTIPGCEEDSVILPGGTGEQEVSIDYTYDALNRLISAEYSNGTAFGYTYDAAGNVLTYAETHHGQTTVTTYTYDAANQLLTATASDSVWYYSYDGNGSQIMSSPAETAANGATRYTYNTAGYLTRVENYTLTGTGTTEWQTQSEMTYDGLGNRLEVTTYTDGEGNTTHYVLDGGSTLTAIGAESSTFYLYGRGVIGTFGESWSYILQDGAGSTRQLVDEEGTVTLSISYTPWGDTMEIYGSGMLNLGYLGGVYDAGTGLIYMGNGQYYDPGTGRFLTRGAQQDQSNPYTPWNSDPAGMLIAPLALLGLVFGRKKTRTKFDQFIILFVIVLSVGLSVSTINDIPVVMAYPIEDDPNDPYHPQPYTPYSNSDENDDGITVKDEIPQSDYQPTDQQEMDPCTSSIIYPEISPEMESYRLKMDAFWSHFVFINMPERKEWYIKEAVLDVGDAFARVIGGESTDAFLYIYALTSTRTMEFRFDECPGCGNGMGFTISSRCIDFNNDPDYDYYGGYIDPNETFQLHRTPDVAARMNVNLVVHELGHAFAGLFNIYDSETGEKLGTNPGHPYTMTYPGVSNSWWLTDEGFNISVPHAYYMWRQHPYDVNEGNGVHVGEAFADMFLGWVYNGEGFSNDDKGRQRKEYMDEHMYYWLLGFKLNVFFYD